VNSNEKFGAGEGGKIFKTGVKRRENADHIIK